MPLFVLASQDNKLDPSDATFVDVFHTNALVQGKVEQCGHVDYYFNGGVYQPVMTFV
jgi:pancreatic lipase-related protein 2